MFAKKYKSIVVEINNILEGIYTLEFKSLGRRYKYEPGQFLHLALDEYDGVGQWPESRCFSMQSSPKQELLKITFSVKGKFTKRMANELNVGKGVWLKLPYGDIFQRGHDKKNCVFIAGGTGITPFLSLFTDSSFADYINPKLYFGVRNKNYYIYKKELAVAVQVNPQFLIKVVYQNEEGLLDINKIFYECGVHSTYFISGPPIMIKSFKKFLLKKNILESNIVTDDWE